MLVDWDSECKQAGSLARLGTVGKQQSNHDSPRSRVCAASPSELTVTGKGYGIASKLEEVLMWMLEMVEHMSLCLSSP